MSGDTFYILVPVIEKRPGGLGLDDIRHLLDSADIEKSYEFACTEPNPTEKVIGAKITRRSTDFHTVPSHNPNSSPNLPLTTQFLLWGGFHKLEPNKSLSDFKESECFTEPHWKQVRMRTALRLCSKKIHFMKPDVYRKLTASWLESDGIVSDSSPASASMDSTESSSPTKLDIPISHESTSNSTQSRSVQTELPQPPSQSSPVLTQLPPEQTPAEPTILPAGQLTPEQKETMELKVKTKQSAAKKTRNQKESKEEDPLQPQSKSIIASFWNFFGR